jgi:hypothetical protein
MNLGIKKDLVSKAGIPINAPIAVDKPNAIFRTHIFPIAVLESVEFLPEFETTDRQTDEVTTQPIVRMVYKDTQNSEKKISVNMYPLEEGDDKFATKLDGMQKSIKHVFEEVFGADKFVEEEFAGTTFAELFENVGKAFNKHTITKVIKKATNETEKDVTKSIKAYTQVPLYLKLVWFNNRLAPTMFPNFVQKAYSTKGNVTTQVPCELSISKRDIILNKTDAKPATATGARGAGFGGGAAFGMSEAEGMDDMVFPEDE